MKTNRYALEGRRLSSCDSVCVEVANRRSTHFLSFMLTLLMFIMGNVGMWAMTETLPSVTAKDVASEGTSSLVSGTYVAGSGNAGKNIKMRTNQSLSNFGVEGNGFCITVKEGYHVTSVTLNAESNASATNLTGVYVDSETTNVLGSKSYAVNAKSGGDVSITISGFCADENIAFKFEDATNQQVNMNVTVEYYTDNFAPIVAIDATSHAYSGSNVTLDANITSVPWVTSVQWYRNTTASNTGGVAIEGANSPSYAFTPTTVDTYYYYMTATNSEGTTASNVCTLTVEESLDFSAVLNNQTGTLLTSEEQVEGTQVSFGVTHAGTRVGTDDPSAVAVISGKYHSEHGLTNLSVAAKVGGTVKISVGQCTFSSNTIIVKNSSGETVASKAPKTACWKNDRSNVTELYYDGPATTLTISGMGYCPYVSVVAIDPSEIPTTVNVTYSKGDTEALGTAPATDEVDMNSSYTLPENHTLYKEGYTLTGWTDGTNTYSPGTQMQTGDEDIALTPVFTANVGSIFGNSSSVSILVDLQRKNGAPLLNLGGNVEGFYVVQAKVDGNETIDVKIDYNTKTGKMANAGWTDWCQLNGGFEFYLPSLKGAVVSLETYAISTETTIDGVALEGNTSKTPSYTVTSNNNPITVVYGGDASYFRWIRVVLPPLPKIITQPTATASIRQGRSVALAVEADNAEAYQWYSNTTDSNEGGTAIQGATSETYGFSTTTDTPAGTYYLYCVVSNAVGSVKTNVSAITVREATSTHTFDFTEWSEGTIAALAADTENWSVWEKAGNIGNQGGFYNKNVMNAGQFLAGGADLEETFSIFGTANAHGIGIINDLGSTDMGTYAGDNYMWLTSANSSAVVIPNVIPGTPVTFGIESHKIAEARGLTVWYGDALAGTWTQVGDAQTTTTFAEKTVTIPVVEGKDYVDVKLQATKGMHLYYIDCQFNDFTLINEELNVRKNTPYTIMKGVDYATTSDAALTYAIEDETIATVSEAGVITPLKNGITTFTATLAAHGDMPAISKSMMLRVADPSDLTLVASHDSIHVVEGNSYSITKGVDYTTSSTGALTFTSSNPETISVTADGVVTVHAIDTVTVTLAQEITNDYLSGKVRFIVAATPSTDLPEITENLSDSLTIYTYTTTTLAIKTKNATNYQWYTCDDVQMTNSVAIEGATSDTYKFRHTTEGTEYYYCVATNSRGRMVSEVCKVKSNRRLEWDFTSNATIDSLLDSSIGLGEAYWTGATSGSKWRYQATRTYTGEELLIDANTYLPMTEGLSMTFASTNVLIGKSTGSNRRLQLGAANNYQIVIPVCKQGDEIKLEANYVDTKSDRNISVSNALLKEGDGNSVTTVKDKSIYEFVVQEDGNVTLTVNNSVLYYIKIVDKNARTLHDYSINAVASDSPSTVLKTYVSSGSAWTLDNIPVYYNYWLRDDDNKLYTHGTGGSQFIENFEINSDTTFLIKYKPTGIEHVVYLSEAEDIPGAVTCSHANAAIRSSMGKSAYSPGDGLTLTTLPEGVYKIKAVLFDPQKSANSVHSFQIGDQVVDLTATATNWTEVESENIEVTKDGTSVVWMPTANQSCGIDAIVIYDTQLPKAFAPEIVLDDENYTFTLTTTEENAEMYYTINGTVPTKTSATLYEGPVRLSNNCTIKAITVAPEKQTSSVAEKTTKYATYKLDVQPWPNTYGTVTFSPESTNGKYLPGTKVAVHALAKVGYAFTGWSSAKDKTPTKTNYIDSIVVAAKDTTIYAIFKKGEKGNVIYDVQHAIVLTNDNQIFIPSTAFKEFLDDGDFDDIIHGYKEFPTTPVTSTAISVPSDYPLYYDQGTLMFWIDATNIDDATHVTAGGWEAAWEALDEGYPEFKKEDYTIYEIGNNKLFETAGQTVKLRPVLMTPPHANLSIMNDLIQKRNKPAEVTWDFRTGYGAQQFTIEKGVSNYYYSTHAVVNTVDYPNVTVDVPIVFNTENISTGETVHNTDIDTWSQMPSGTKIIVPSGYGAKFTLTTYAPINVENGTTINGKLPDNIYDEDLKKNSDGAYPYVWTVEDNDNTAELVIGADYSYYQTLKAELPTSAVKELFFSSNNTGMGKVTTDVAPQEILSDGGYSYINGSTVNLIANRSRFYELKYWLDDNGNKYYTDGHYVDSTGVNRGNFVGKKIDDITFSKVTADSLIFALERVYTIQAVFGEKTSYYIDFSTGGNEGLPLYQQHVEWDEKFVMPKHNQNVYREGYTLDYYYDEADETKHYLFGGSYLATKNMLLVPHFKANTKSLGDVTAATTVTWPLAVAEGATEINYNRSAGLIVDQLHFDGDSIDLPLYIDGTSGAANNTSDDAYCAVASGCIMKLPTVNGCQISLSASNGNFVNTTIAGSSSQNTGSATKYTVGKTVTVTYNGTNSQEQIRYREARQCTWVKATYMPITTKPELDTVYVANGVGLGEKLAVLRADGTVSGVTATPNYEKNTLGNVTATATNGGSVNITQATPDNPTATLLVNTAGGVTVGTYTINFEAVNTETPVLLSAVVSGNKATTDGSSTVEAGTNGVVKLTFNHAMSDMKLTAADHGLTTSEDGNIVTAVAQTNIVNSKNVYTLNLTYWGVTEGLNTLTIPANTLTDACGTPYPEDITVKFNAKAREDVSQRVFNFVVTHKQSWDAETQTAGELIQTVTKDVLDNLDSLGVSHGTIDEGIALAHSAGNSDRYYIFVPNGEYQLKGNHTRTGTYNDTKKGNNQGLKIVNYYNGETWISRNNVSIIGQSKEGTTLFNDPFIYGISYTSTIEVSSKNSDCYFQDLTIDNRYSKYQVDRGDANPGGQAVAVYDRGIHSIWKNIAMKGYQDTFASGTTTSGSTTNPGCFHNYCYYEDCDIWGTVDFICGGGDSWWERPTFVLRKRDTGNNIVAARQTHTNISCNYTGSDYMFDEKWGYVFNKGVIKAESTAAYDKQNGRYTIARTWGGSPANTYLYTTFEITPDAGGYSNMSQNLVCRMHEYGSMNADGTAADLTKRTIRASTPAAGSDDCILTDEQAAQYTIHNVLGGDEAYDPTIYTESISMANSALNNATDEQGNSILQWTAASNALCYMIFRIDETTGDTLFYTMTTSNRFLPDESQAGRKFLIRAANKRGGLGDPTVAVEYKPLETYEVEVHQVGSNPEMGWATVCLPQNVTFKDEDNFSVYRGVLLDSDTRTINLKKVKGSENLVRGHGYIIYAKPGIYTFRGTYNISNSESILSGNPEDHAVSVGTLNIYTLSYKPEISSEVGMYKYTAQTIPAHKAYLEDSMLEKYNIHIGEAKMSFAFFDEDDEYLDEADAIDGVSENESDEIDILYDLSGKRIESSQMRKGEVYIKGNRKFIY